jgi:hypothetical protein
VAEIKARAQAIVDRCETSIPRLQQGVEARASARWRTPEHIIGDAMATDPRHAELLLAQWIDVRGITRGTATGDLGKLGTYGGIPVHASRSVDARGQRQLRLELQGMHGAHITLPAQRQTMLTGKKVLAAIAQLYGALPDALAKEQRRREQATKVLAGDEAVLAELLARHASHTARPPGIGRHAEADTGPATGHAVGSSRDAQLGL